MSFRVPLLFLDIVGDDCAVNLARRFLNLIWYNARWKGTESMSSREKLGMEILTYWNCEESEWLFRRFEEACPRYFSLRRREKKLRDKFTQISRPFGSTPQPQSRYYKSRRWEAKVLLWKRRGMIVTFFINSLGPCIRTEFTIKMTFITMTVKQKDGDL